MDIFSRHTCLSTGRISLTQSCVISDSGALPVLGILRLEVSFVAECRGRLPPIATIQTKSQKSRRVDLKAGLIKDDTGEHKNIVLLLHEHAVGNLDPITMKK